MTDQHPPPQILTLPPLPPATYPQLVRLDALVYTGEFTNIYFATRAPPEGVQEPVAVKIYQRDQVRRSADLARRVSREQHTLGVLSGHPHPFIITGTFAHLDERHIFLGMERVGDGGDLLSLMERSGGFLEPARARLCAGEMCLALGHLHSFDLVYRNLKPENVLLGIDGHVKLIDFGNCYKLHGRVDDTPPPAVHDMTMNDTMTPEFLAPEILVRAVQA